MTETDSMVERVAKAMAKAMFENSGNEPGSMDEYLDIVAPTLFGQARAAIEAMKEPTPVVLEEGYNKLDFDDGVDDNAEEFNRRVVQRVWSAMIRKALEE